MKASATGVLDALTRVARALRDPTPGALFGALDAATRDTLGHRMFTLMIFHADRSETERVYTDQPGAYPVGGRKRVVDSPWSRQVFVAGTPWVGRTAVDIRAVFPDHALILSVGGASILERLGGGDARSRT